MIQFSLTNKSLEMTNFHEEMFDDQFTENVLCKTLYYMFLKHLRYTDEAATYLIMQNFKENAESKTNLLEFLERIV